MSTSGTQTLQGLLQATKENTAIVCAWCAELHIMKLPRQPHDRIDILIEGTRLVILRNGQQMPVSHGICSSCTAVERKRARVARENAKPR
jgi:hypothetical protein